MDNLTPQQIVAELEKYIVGQEQAKRAVAIALRNRYRRSLLPEELRDEVAPKNVMMIGPTGVGKTEIARRVAKMLDAPFVKAEATKFTEVGYVGRDVESIIQDVVDASVDIIYQRRLQEVESQAQAAATERIIDYLCQQQAILRPSSRRRKLQATAEAVAQASSGAPGEGRQDRKGTADAGDGKTTVPPKPIPLRIKRKAAELLSKNELEDVTIEIEVSPDLLNATGPLLEFASGVGSEEEGETFQEFVHSYQRKKIRTVSVREARRLLTREEANKLIDLDAVVDIAIEKAEQSAVVFIDEIDKITGPRIEVGADVSGEGVQRDLLPIIEGSTVMTRYGPVKTDHMLFIAAGTFYQSKVSDLIPELQGRFPIRVELKSLGQKDFERILTEPENALTKQYQALLATEGVELEFTLDGISKMALMACIVNEQLENIGARRLYTVMEKVLEDLSFHASDHRGEKVVVDAEYVRQRLSALEQRQDLSRYIL